MRFVASMQPGARAVFCVTVEIIASRAFSQVLSMQHQAEDCASPIRLSEECRTNRTSARRVILRRP